MSGNRLFLFYAASFVLLVLDTVQAKSCAICVLGRGASNSVTGTITLTQESDSSSTLVTGRLNGLAPGDHGFHVHEFGDYSGGCASFGGHYNPYGRNHGSPSATERHVGDLGNIVADADGTADVIITDKQLTLTGNYSIIGRGFVVHEKKDDLGLGGDAESLKTGNAGSRLACCVIGVAKCGNDIIG